VLELGTDKPGDIAKFSWLKPHIAVVTAVTQEHMEFFITLDAVAVEELSVASFSDKTFFNKNMIDSSFLKYANSDVLYGYSREDIIRLGLVPEDLQIIGAHSAEAVAAGVAVGEELGMKVDDLKNGAKLVTPQKGRMHILSGVEHTVLIDDTYNSSPEAAIAALKYLYTRSAPRRIALLGNMNELGKSSAEAHQSLGDYCDPKKLDLVVTLGTDANKYTLDAAKAKGCNVLPAKTPYEAAEIIKQNIQPGSIILFKGSQNGVFAEEAVKLLLVDKKDSNQLVRQDKFWLKRKKTCFDELN
jgi:UDP-N-acetylmuramoyl-tripeptide--D-alanyl-D-alanine ligase